MDIRLLHHVSLPVHDLEVSRRFYREIIGLNEIVRPNFPFGGAWFRLGAKQELHLIVAADIPDAEATYRDGKGINSEDIHLALRVASYRRVVEFLGSKGYTQDGDSQSKMRMKLNPHSITGYPQIYILDPDRHMIEINADALD
ncbi:MAG: VOC family protein [Acidobacteriia bacterium]|nr:VOC family protein [Terriglobia bacterium]